MSPRDYISGIGFPLLLCRFPYQGFPSSIGEKGNIVVVLLLITGILNTSILVTIFCIKGVTYANVLVVRCKLLLHCFKPVKLSLCQSVMTPRDQLLYANVLTPCSDH